MSYNATFGLSASPFLDVPDQRFLFLGKRHDALLSELVEFVTARQGIALVSGDEGVGKTMLVQALLQRLPSSFRPLVITNPEAEPLAITLLIARMLGLNLGERGLVNLTPLAEAVQGSAQKQTHFVLIMEDAHLLTDQNLEEIYMLSQIAYQGQQVMPILLVGRRGLVQKVGSKANQRLQGLIRKNLSVPALTFEETPLYIDHRLKQAGSSFKACFAEGCWGQIFSRTGGIPRRINQVCDQALIRAWQENRSRVTRDLFQDVEPVPVFKPLTLPPRWRALKSSAAVAVVLLGASLGTYALYQSFYRLPPPQPSSPVPVTLSSPAAPSPTLPSLTREKPVPEPQAQSLPREQVESGNAVLEESGPAVSPDYLEPEKGQELVVADIDTDATVLQTPPSSEESPEPQDYGSSTYEVTPDDGLLRIAASHYPGSREIGYDAIILANPEINNEDVIYSGQKLSLPRIDRSTKVITLSNKEHFAVFGHYYSHTQAQKAAAKLDELQLRYRMRETALPGAGTVYRIFLGGYENMDDLKKAMTLAQQK